MAWSLASTAAWSGGPRWAPPRRSSGKLSLADSPRRRNAALSYASAASSAVSKVPSQRRVRLRGRRISATHLPQCRCLTPRYSLTGARAAAAAATATAPCRFIGSGGAAARQPLAAPGRRRRCSCAWTWSTCAGVR
ncbi:Os03g0191850 [Oryza sativa Japonica Group]|uniref:Os03g0191850 protein n=1 Tax=Oryza sativa subsp. japonica TaxID=39947 RepID=A0A0P0VU21_ORYSJ|nr:hypothetical protein EE612_015812 [Oryza sativa]BAS82724.1 Os03g0191850 [Oryza sativa Japonica Group]